MSALRTLASYVVALSCCVQVAGCAHQRPSQDSAFAPYAKATPVGDDVATAAMRAFPADATWVALEQGFALLRHAQTDDDVTRARDFLERAYTSFEDLRAPENFNAAFSADADVPYRGRPHERVLAATTLALLDISRGRCDIAIPTLRSAEFLDVRWQKLAFGTDASIVYALALRCLVQSNGRPEDIARARAGLRLTLRHERAALAVDDWIDAVVDALPRSDALSQSVARELLMMGLQTALAADANATNSAELLASAESYVLAWGNKTDELLATPERVAQMDAIAATTGGHLSDQEGGVGGVRLFVRSVLPVALRTVREAALLDALATRSARAEVDDALREAEVWALQAEQLLTAPRVHFVLQGLGPRVERRGDYNEIAEVVPRQGVSTEIALEVRGGTGNVDAPCGVRGNGQSVDVVLCAAAVQPAAVPTLVTSDGVADAAPATGAQATHDGMLRLWSSSIQATSVVGRRFNEILAGRAVLRGTTDAIGTAAMWTTWALWRAGLAMLAACAVDGATAQTSTPHDATRWVEAKVRGGSSAGRNGRRQRSSSSSTSSGDVDATMACSAVAMGVLGAGAVVAGVGAAVWLAGSTVNPAADARFVQSLPEEIMLVGVGGLP